MSPIRLLFPIIYIALFIGYVVYMILTKKDSKGIKQVVYQGLFFIAVWILIYYLILA